MNDYLTQTTVSKSDFIFHALNVFSCVVKNSPATIYHEQLTAITKLHKIFIN